MTDAIRAQVFKYRGLLWGIFALAVFVCPASWSPLRMAIAVPLLVAGQLLRFWAAGFIPKYRTLTVDAPKLVTSGPYAWVRNPLYAGNGLMGCGWAVMVGWWWLPAFVAAYWVIYSLIIIPYEERFLLERFKDEYLQFKSTTPSMFPSPAVLFDLKNRIAQSKGGFDRAKSWFMERHSLRMNIVVTVLVLVRLFALNY